MNEPMLGRTVDPVEFGQLDTFPVDTPVRRRFETPELRLCARAFPDSSPTSTTPRSSTSPAHP